MEKNTTFFKIGRILGQLINIIEDWGSFISFLIMIGLVNLAIFLRMTINLESSSWEEIARFASIWLYMLAVAVAARDDSHLRSGLLDNWIKSAKTRMALEILFNLITLTCLIIFVYWSLVQVRWVIGVGQTSLVLRIDMWIVYLSFVVGGTLAVIHNLTYLMKAIEKFKKLKEIRLSE
ncbi:MAG: TRAP transporter small permease subunit [Atribacterota bacterium]|nr:TRAP transporter small permease subunit [Atribacterota bacterium]MDD5497247.1 TRAP transporter small permease subunit [Atribacterota bacterium]